mgnify:CR=1 FL=1
MKENQDTSHTLLKKLQRNEGQHWEEFVHYYEGYIYVVIRNFDIRKEDAEDLLQDVLVKVWKALPSYNYEEDKCRFRTWLCVVIRNTVFNFYELRASKNNKKNVSYEEVLEGLNLITEAEIDKLAAREWKSYISNMAWDKVKDDFSEISRQIFEASMHEDSNSVLAEKFNVAESSVRVYKMRVRKTLLKEIVRLNQELGG